MGRKTVFKNPRPYTPNLVGFSTDFVGLKGQSDTSNAGAGRPRKRQLRGLRHAMSFPLSRLITSSRHVG